MELEDLADEDYCYFTTTGRVSGRPHEIEIWFAMNSPALYMLSGGGDRADWVKNLRHNPEVTARIRGSEFRARGRIVDDMEEDELARRLLFEKYQPRTGGDLTRWRGSALPVAVDLGEPLRQ